MFPIIRNGGCLLEKLLQKQNTARQHLYCSNYRHSWLCSSLTTSASSSSNTNESSGSPPPIRVALTDSAGRGTFATRRIGAGDLIHTADPIVSHPSISLLSNVCYLCLKRLGMKSSGISVPPSATAGPTRLFGPRVGFCSEECREKAKAFYEVEKTADWSEFNDHCRLLGLKYPFLVKRLACMIISGAASIDCLDILQPARLFPEMVLELEEEFQLLRYTFLKAGYDEQITFLTKQWYISVLARIRINGFRVEIAGGSYEDLFSAAAASVVRESAVGNAVYILPSFYNHDCDPNAHIIWIENANARLKALRDIEADEELRICYIDASMNHGARQSILLEGFGFQCSCQRCISRD